MTNTLRFFRMIIETRAKERPIKDMYLMLDGIYKHYGLRKAYKGLIFLRFEVKKHILFYNVL
jgi:hypothetical protein